MEPALQVVKVLRRNLLQALRTCNLGEAESVLQQLKLEAPLSLETRGLELEYLIAANQWSNAKLLAEQLLRLYPDSARIQFFGGRIYYREKAYSRALQCFTESNLIHKHARTQRWIGKTLTQAGHFSQAEGFLLALVDSFPSVSLDLAWLYERSEQPLRALEYVESYLKKYPDDQFAKTQQLRLRSISMEPDALAEDVDTLLDLDENIPPEMLPVYIQNLLTSGNGQVARQFISNHKQKLDGSTAASIAWNCHKLQAYDLALELFIHGLIERSYDVKYLSALESAARHCNRVAELIPHYESLAESEKRLYGRITKLRKELGT